jgi:uncharacterized membrane protein YfcA
LVSAWLAVAIAVVVGATVKGLTGMGLPPVALPVMAIFVGVEDAVVIMALPTVVTNLALLVGTWEYRHDNPALPPMVAAGAVGGLIGAWLLTNLDGKVIAVSLAVLVVAYVVSRLSRTEWTMSPAVVRRTRTPVGLVGGVLQGATGLSGTLFGSYLHAMSLRPQAFVFSISALFQVSALASAIGLAALGRYDARLLGLSVLASVLALTVVIGVRPFARRVPQHAFDMLVLVVLVGSVVAMLVDAFSGGE